MGRQLTGTTGAETNFVGDSGSLCSRRYAGFTTVYAAMSDGAYLVPGGRPINTGGVSRQTNVRRRTAFHTRPPSEP